MFSAAQVQAALGAAAAAIPAARQAVLRSLAIQTVRAYTRNTSGAGGAKAGAYPIPIRSGTLRRGINFQLADTAAIVFNDTVYARPQERGYQPYGNKHARPIPPRPALADALDSLDLQAAADAWAAQAGAQ